MTLATDALCSVDEVIEFGKFQHLPDDESFIERLINSITQEFKSYCDVKSFKTAQHTEYYDGNGDSFVFPKNTPITAVTLLADDEDYVWGTDSTFTATDYLIIDEGKGIHLKDDIFGSFINNIKITYTAGYTNIPDDLKQTAITEVVRKYNHRRDFDVIRQTIGEQDAEYVDPGLLSETKMVLSHYRNFR
jgi:hypothetical protein